MNATTAAHPKTGTSPVVSALSLLLADSYALMALTHHAHWNVEGPGFFSLHKAFEEQYEHLFHTVDELAEHIRSLDAYAPGGLATLAKTAAMEEFKTGLQPAKDFVAGLVVAHEKALADAERLRDVSGEADDLETQDLAIDRVKWHKKTLWMLKSYLKSA